MSREELIELVADNQAGDTTSPATSTHVVEIDGLEVEIDYDKTSSWAAFRIATKLNGEINADSIDAMMAFIDQVTSVNEQIIVEHCGGADANIVDVMTLASKILTECYPKK